METSKIFGALVSGVGAMLAFDTAPLLTVILFVTCSILGGMISSRFIMRGVPKLIDAEIAKHLEQFHREYVPPPKADRAANYRAPR